jgi:two-component system response regulator RegX3
MTLLFHTLPPNDVKPKLALLDDDLMFAAAARDWLEDAGYQVSHYPTGQSCLNGMAEQDFDICIFDWYLPDLDGPSVMRALQTRQRMPPVIFLTAVDDCDSVSQVLLAGADDYVIKPPTFTVLHARIQALLRRMTHKEGLPNFETLGMLRVDHLKKTIYLDGQVVPLTNMESVLAFCLLTHRGQLVTRSRLYKVMGVEQLAVDTRRLDVHISRLRSKLHLTAEHGWRLASVHLQGYRLEFSL